MLEFGDEAIGTITVPKKITEKNIENIVVTAIESGCQYWMYLEDINFQDKPEDEFCFAWIVGLIILGHTVYICDSEDFKERWELTFEKLLKGIEIFLNEKIGFDLNDVDANDADCIMQFALFGKLVYS